MTPLSPMPNAAAADVVLPEITPSYRGKVRDIYDLGKTLLIVATDRVSAYDSILPTPIPGKGIALTQIAAFWFRNLPEIGPHHLLSTQVADFPEPFCQHTEALAGRTMWVKKAKRLDFECVVRGYLAGSGWRDYQETGAVCGVALPSGLQQSAAFAEPIFTPATKVDDGHDENVSFEFMAGALGAGRAAELRERSLAIFAAASRHAAARGLLLADTKFEFGLVDGELMVIDEVLTPDSSRFWPARDYAPGRPQEAFDKQFVRDYLDQLQWDRQPPAPTLPTEVVQRTQERYATALAALMGPPLDAT